MAWRLNDDRFIDGAPFRAGTVFADGVLPKGTLDSLRHVGAVEECSEPAAAPKDEPPPAATGGKQVVAKK